MLSAATGVDYSTEEFRKCGERIWNLERLFNIGAGFSRKDDTLPGRFFGSGIESPYLNTGISRAEFEKALDEYYGLRGWDENGAPTREKLGGTGTFIMLPSQEKAGFVKNQTVRF